MLWIPSGLIIAIQLIALGIGFIVYYLAKREEKALKAIGYIIGISIIVLAGILVLDRLLMHYNRDFRRCALRQRGIMMPMRPAK